MKAQDFRRSPIPARGPRTGGIIDTRLGHLAVKGLRNPRMFLMRVKGQESPVRSLSVGDIMVMME